MKILLDTNIVLDILLKREKFFLRSREIFILVEEKKVEGFLSASSFTTIYYLISKYLSKKEADESIEILLKLFDVTYLDKNIIKNAVENNGVDFEDSVIYTSAYYEGIDYIITRDKRGFKNSKVECLNPNNFLAFWNSL